MDTAVPSASKPLAPWPDASVPVPSIEWDMDRLPKRSAELHPTLADDRDKLIFAYLLRVNQREVALGLAVNGKVILNGELVEFDLTPDFLADVLSPDIFVRSLQYPLTMHSICTNLSMLTHSLFPVRAPNGLPLSNANRTSSRRRSSIGTLP